MNSFNIWWEASRAFSFTAAVIPVLLGTALAARDGFFSTGLFFWTLVGAVLLQAGTNFTNDYHDYLKGADRLDEDGVDLAGPSMVIQRGLLSQEAVRRAGLNCFFLGAVVGLYLASQSRWWLILPGLLSVAAGYYYTAGNRPLAYRALGECTVFFFMGPVIVGGAYLVQTGCLGLSPLMASVPVALLVTAILQANNLRDLNRDKQRGKKTLATVLGPTGATLELALLVVGSYLSVAALIYHDTLPVLCGLAFLSSKDAVEILKTCSRGPGSTELNRNVLRCAQLHAKFGLLLSLGVVISCYFNW